jgi:hypothetical protein
MNTKNLSDFSQMSDSTMSLDDELFEIMARANTEMPELIEKIKEYQQYCSNIKAYMPEISVKEDLTNG